MLRHSLVLAALLATSLFSANGCRSCSSCHDYDPPVANCNCGPYGPQCGCNGGCCGGGCSSCGCSGGGCSGCGCGGGSVSNGAAYSQQGQMAEPTPTSPEQSVSPMGEQPGM